MILGSGYVEVGMSWKDAMTQRGYSLYLVSCPEEFLDLTTADYFAGCQSLQRYCQRQIRFKSQSSRHVPRQVPECTMLAKTSPGNTPCLSLTASRSLPCGLRSLREPTRKHGPFHVQSSHLGHNRLPESLRVRPLGGQLHPAQRAIRLPPRPRPSQRHLPGR